MEPEGSFPHWQVPATCPYPEPARSSPYPNIPLSEDPPYYYPPIYACVSQVASSLRFPHENHIYVSTVTHTRYMPRPSHSSRFYHPKKLINHTQWTECLTLRILSASKETYIYKITKGWNRHEVKFLTDSEFYEGVSLNDINIVRGALRMVVGFSLYGCVCYLVLKGAVNQ